jgi:hypothetical protein
LLNDDDAVVDAVVDEDVIELHNEFELLFTYLLGLCC